ncbi:MAG: glycosyltransferase [Nostocales cyanobacterium 94392]|nr:glycosyltransferase [Nostocales cyanobacterium 94392]
MEKISYVVPTLNSANTLDMTLLSLKKQKNININIIVVDSGSTDGTLDICKRWNIKTLYADPGNMYSAINVGLRECHTEWLGYINSDDWLYPDSVTRLIAQGNAFNADIVYGNCDFTDAYGRFMYSFAPPKPNQLVSTSRTGETGIAQQSVIFRKSLYEKLNGFNENYYFAGDAEFFTRAINYGAIFSFLPGSSVACFRLHTNQLSQTKSKSMQAEGKRIKAELLDSAHLYDWVVTTQWKQTNLFHYLLRLLRQSLLANRLEITKSMHPGTHLDNLAQVHKLND